MHRMSRTSTSTLALGLALATAGCADSSSLAPAPSLARGGAAIGTSYAIAAPAGGNLPERIEDRIAAAGGTVTSRLPQLGLVFATSPEAAFADRVRKLPGVSAVVPDEAVQWVRPSTVQAYEAAVADAPDAETAATPINPAAESFWALQWAPRSVDAPKAWNDGAARGAGVRIAIIDGGIHSTHIDIAPNLDVAASRSFVPGRSFNQDGGDCEGTFWHGTHVAGIAAAPANRLGTIGIAPEARIIGVKALDNCSGSFEWIINAIVYAALPQSAGGAGAQVINMSLGAGFPRQGVGAAQLASYLGRATMFARQRGVTVIAALGNDGLDLDHTANVIFVPAQSPGVVAVSATGPVNFFGGGTNYTRLASYSNYGRSATDIGAPGGDFTLYPNANWFYDMVIAPCRGTTNGNYCFAAGTSMASPAVAGVAALILGKYGPLSPAEVETRLRASAVSLTSSEGKSVEVGHGYLNAYRAVE